MREDIGVKFVEVLEGGRRTVWAYFSQNALEQDFRSFYRGVEIEVKPVREEVASRTPYFSSEQYISWAADKGNLSNKFSRDHVAFNLGQLHGDEQKTREPGNRPHRTLQDYLREKIGGEDLDYHRVSRRHLDRCAERAHEDTEAAAIIEIDNLFRSFPDPLLAEDFSLTDTRMVDEAEVVKHIKDYYSGIGFEYSGYNCGLFDFRKGDAHFSVNLTWLPGTVIVSVLDDKTNSGDHTGGD